ncbi:hypothetical protein [Brachybacterium sacelli]|uniref:hypothetical protein n=1 Tax=Brachybacterium sacelli TaxID=173364 RepID=UPI003616D3B8
MTKTATPMIQGEMNSSPVRRFRFSRPVSFRLPVAPPVVPSRAPGPLRAVRSAAEPDDPARGGVRRDGVAHAHRSPFGTRRTAIGAVMREQWASVPSRSHWRSGPRRPV